MRLEVGVLLARRRIPLVERAEAGRCLADGRLDRQYKSADRGRRHQGISKIVQRHSCLPLKIRPSKSRPKSPVRSLSSSVQQFAPNVQSDSGNAKASEDLTSADS